MGKGSDELKPFLFPDHMETDRLWMKKHTENLASEMYRLIEVNHDRLMAFVPWTPRLRSTKETRRWIMEILASWKDKELFDYGLFRKRDGVFMGSLCIHSIAWLHGRGEFGYWLGQEFEGQGYVSEALLVLEKFCFESGFTRLEIRCDPRNSRSTGIPLRCGYAQEGHLRQDIIINDIRRDSLVFGKLKSDPRTA